MVLEADFNHDGRIAFDQFQKLMRDDVPASPGGKGSPIMRKKTARLSGALQGVTGEIGNGLIGEGNDMLMRSPSRTLRRRPSQIYTGNTHKHILPIQIDDRSVQLGAPSPLMKQGRKSIKTSPADKKLWEEKTIPESVNE